MDLDLARGLRDLSDEPTLPDEAVHVATVLARVRRARTLRTAGVGAVSAAAVVVLAVAVQAAPFREPDAPPAEPTRSATPAPELTPTPRPTPTSQPGPPTPDPSDATVDPAVDRPVVGLTTDGRLVVLDPATGAEVVEVATGLGTGEHGAVSLSPDGATAYVQTDAADDQGFLIREVRLADGAVTVVAHGRHPSVSPDGRFLAYVAEAPGTTSYATSGVRLRDLTSGAERFLRDDEYCECDRATTGVEWSPDGTRIAVGLGYTEMLSDVEVTVVDLAGTTSLQAGLALAVSQSGAGTLVTRSAHTYLPDGRLAVASLVQGHDESYTQAWHEALTIDLLDPATGAVLQSVPAPTGFPVDLSVAPDGVSLLLTTSVHEPGAPLPRFEVHRWDGTQLTPFTEGLLGTAW